MQSETRMTKGHMSRSRKHLSGDQGEGVISMAIAILIIAAIGALMFVGLQTMWSDTESKTLNQLESIGGTTDG